jgi:hypothetical protein
MPTECTTTALHCVQCGRPSDLMQGALSTCCQKRVTRKSTCDGAHPTWEVAPGATEPDVDQVLVPYLREIAGSLVNAGREPAQALDDLDRAVTTLRAELASSG